MLAKLATMKSLTQTLLFTTATCATLQPRQSNSSCCFQLASVGKVNETVLEDHVGDLLLGGSFQEGGFCLDKTTRTIQDSLKHNCFMRAPDYQFECYQGAVGTTAFDVTKTNEKLYLAYDNGPGTFYACPIGSGTEETYDIYSSEKADKTGCLSVALTLTNETPECSTGSNSTVVARSRTVRPSRTLRRQAQSQVCSVSPSAPSLAPYRVRASNSSAVSGVNNTIGEAVISSGSSTTFEYAIPRNFLAADAAKSSLCALQFRMPVCTSLPKGYPCYSFSGLEQEILSNSGMAFDLTADDGGAAWNGTELHQVFPGENTTIGTFDCGQAGGYGGRKMSWKVSSVRNFALEFVQAGVGQDAKFQDGIGAWIVPCQ
ncbi:hypothetical protein F5Y06DRAFT_257936 [Hypoxylon sp. FL0890]|nr:hypothetical protein F5Y06DRAFT_257936 [Hypoxylon sp. FL0890]